jgi:hypothetical protein
MFAKINIRESYKLIQLHLPLYREDVKLIDKMKKLQKNKEKYMNEWGFILHVNCSRFSNSDVDKKTREFILRLLDDIPCTEVRIRAIKFPHWPPFFKEIFAKCFMQCEFVLLNNYVNDTTIHEIHQVLEEKGGIKELQLIGLKDSTNTDFLFSKKLGNGMESSEIEFVSCEFKDAQFSHIIETMLSFQSVSFFLVNCINDDDYPMTCEAMKLLLSQQ